MHKSFILYHWSPISRRKQILKYGLCPNRKSRCGQWKAPYICFSNSPSFAWGASAGMDNERGLWDLWMVWTDYLTGYKKLPTYGTSKTCEIRVYHRIPKKHIWYVGTRERIPRGKYE